MTLNELNTVQLEAESALWHNEQTIKALLKVRGFAGAKQKAYDLRKVLEFIVKEVNKYEHE
jgi:hypothetical protein